MLSSQLRKRKYKGKAGASICTKYKTKPYWLGFLA